MAVALLFPKRILQECHRPEPNLLRFASVVVTSIRNREHHIDVPCVECCRPTWTSTREKNVGIGQTREPEQLVFCEEKSAGPCEELKTEAEFTASERRHAAKNEARGKCRMCMQRESRLAGRWRCQCCKNLVSEDRYLIHPVATQ